MEAAVNDELSELLVETLARTCSDSMLFCMSVSRTYEIAKRAGYPAVREFYADRDYDNSGSIVFRRQVARPRPDDLAAKCVRACREGVVRTVEGEDIAIEFDSICFHSDTPGALEIGRAVRSALDDAGIRIAPAATVLGLQ